MPDSIFDRDRVRTRPLTERKNRVRVSDAWFDASIDAPTLPSSAVAVLDELVEGLRRAREAGASRMCAFGAHTIKNGLGPLLIRLIEDEWFTHLATNGAGIIHDWELAYLGETSEDVRENIEVGQFGLWEETGKYINLALAVGAYEGLGYGESVGAMIDSEHLTVPDAGALRETVTRALETAPEKAAAAADLLALIQKYNLPPAVMAVGHPYKRFSLQAAARRLGVPLTGHPMIGHDIIYTHPMNRGAVVGRTGERDFLRYAQSVSELNGGAYLSIGSAVMSPMIFEKSLSMVRNVSLQRGETVDDFLVVVADLAESTWDWSTGEPPEDNPDYYLRYNKTFARMGGALRYISLDNRLVLAYLTEKLCGA